MRAYLAFATHMKPILIPVKATFQTLLPVAPALLIGLLALQGILNHLPMIELLPLLNAGQIPSLKRDSGMSSPHEYLVIPMIRH